MAQETLMQTAARLAASLEALAALAAYVTVVTEDLDVDPRARELLVASPRNCSAARPRSSPPPCR